MGTPRPAKRFSADSVLELLLVTSSSYQSGPHTLHCKIPIWLSQF